MKAQVEQLAKMSETLESSGFTRPQSNAVTESVALATETFAVRPEILDDRIGRLDKRFDSQGEEIKDLRKSVNRLEQNMLQFQRSMHELQRSMMRNMLAFLLLMLGAVVGMFRNHSWPAIRLTACRRSSAGEVASAMRPSSRVCDPLAARIGRTPISRAIPRAKSYSNGTSSGAN